MRKWTRRYSPFLLIIMVILMSGAFHVSGRAVPEKVEREERVIPVQNLQKEGSKIEKDSHYLQILKQLKEKVDGWLKDLNDQIESEDVTRFKVRFLEILRNILEWVKEKIDSKIESLEQNKPEKEEGGLSQETHQTIFPLLEIG